MTKNQYRRSNMKTLLTTHRDQIIREWLNAAGSDRPLPGSLPSAGGNPFLHPMEARCREAAEAMLDCLLEENSADQDENTLAAVEEFMRVRAVQNIPPEANIRLLYAFKNIIHSLACPEKTADADGLREWRRLDQKLDALIIPALGAYIRCRDALAQLRVEEFKKRHAQLFRLAGIIPD